MTPCCAILKIPPRCIWRSSTIRGEWLLDLPMLAQDYLSWSRQMTGLLQGQRAEWSARWRQLCAGLDPLAPADEARLADIAAAPDGLSPRL